jgi:hypothetical protein
MEIRRTAVFLIRLRALPSVDDDVRALRAALKVLLRRFGLKCLSVEMETETANQGGEDGGGHEEA